MTAGQRKLALACRGPARAGTGVGLNPGSVGFADGVEAVRGYADRLASGRLITTGEALRPGALRP